MPVDLRANVRKDEVDLGKINWTLKQFRLDELTDYYKNPRSLSEKEFKQLKTSLDKFGMIDKPIVNADSLHTIIGGHQRKHVLEAGGAKEVECWIPDRELSDKEVEELNIRLNKNTGSWDFDVLANEFELDDLLEWGFDKGELDLDLWANEAPEDVEPQIDKAEELRIKWGVETGQLWQLGEHQVLCGDARVTTQVKQLDTDNVAVILTDPPYSSGGFQEAQRKSGSIGTRQNIQIASDQLSTRGYLSLMSEVLAIVQTDCLYMFTDWRMWCWTYDIAERANYPVRSMLVWDKGKMGMGFPWRSTHELILFAKRTPSKMMDGKTGNVLRFDRVPNENHPTEKPVEIFAHILGNTPDGDVYDPFLGSGTTLIACEQTRRKCRAVEISPAYVAVAIQRWVDVTGGVPELVA